MADSCGLGPIQNADSTVWATVGAETLLESCKLWQPLLAMPAWEKAPAVDAVQQPCAVMGKGKGRVHQVMLQPVGCHLGLLCAGVL